MMMSQHEQFCTNLTRVFSHEMLTPLTPILAYSRRLSTNENGEVPESGELQELNSEMYHNALRLQHLLENYLLYTRLQIARYRPEQNSYGEWAKMSELQPHEKIQEWAMLKAWRMNRQDDLSIDVAETRLVGSEYSLWKIVDEVVGNAFKFSTPGTPVRIVSAQDSCLWRLDISDRGRGMTSEQLARIDAFIQFDREQFEQQGVGLGLVLVQLLTRLQHGECRLKSAPNQGTTVTLEFPKL